MQPSESTRPDPSSGAPSSAASRISSRTVKVFISSTFQDFQAERDELVKKTFPALRDYCAKKRILFVDVDLRWGITREQAEAGEILPLCLAEINNCRPFFIGLLGERYGWVPADLPRELLQQHPWLVEHKQKSITELEILHGAIRNRNMDGKRFFYFRSPSYHLSLPSREHAKYISDDDASAAKLRHLKAQIREEAKMGRLKLVESYPDPAKLAELVFQDMKEAIDADFPETYKYDELESERLAHHVFIDSQASTLIERSSLTDEAIRRLSSQLAPLVVTGPPGSGKTSLLVNLALRLKDSDPQTRLFAHFVGVTANSTDYIQIIKQMIGELADPDHVTTDIPEGFAELVEYFSRFVEDLPTDHTTFIVLDGLDQIADVENALKFRWLPESFPDHVKLVVSTSSPDVLRVFASRSWSKLEVPDLEPSEQRQIILKYLRQYGKQLDSGQIELILNSRPTASPLFLRAFLEEVRIFGEFTTLNDRMKHYLVAQDTIELYDKILERLEADFEGAHPGLVQRAFSMLWASRYGLTEIELREMLGVPQAVWSHLYLAIQASLINTMGYITFFHQYLGNAVENRYLSTTDERTTAHKALAAYFEKTEDHDRKAEELPWQLEKAEDWESLKNCLCSFDVFSKLMHREKQGALLRYWKSLQSRYNLAETYTEALQRYEASHPSPSRLSARLTQVSEFLTRCGFVREATAVLHRLKEIDDETFDAEYLGELQERRIENLLKLAARLAECQQFEQAERVLGQATEVFKRIPNGSSATHANTLNSLAYVQKCMERYDEAEAHYRTAISLQSLPAYKNNLATLLKEQGRLEEAENLYRTILSEEEPDEDHRASYLANLGDVLLKKGDPREAEERYREAIDINRKTLGPHNYRLAVNLSRYAHALTLRMRPAEAEKAISEAVSIMETSLGPDDPRTKDAHAQRDTVGLMRKIDEHFRSRGPAGDAEDE